MLKTNKWWYYIVMDNLWKIFDPFYNILNKWKYYFNKKIDNDLIWEMDAEF